VLVELGLVEQRYKAVSEVLVDGATVTDVARRLGVSRQTVHNWLRRYGNGGMADLADRSCRPHRSPRQTPAELEATIVAMRVAHPAWGPRRIRVELDRAGVDLVPARSTVYRILVRNRLVDPRRRRRRREDYRRWERTRAMELWQMDVMGRVRLSDRTELSVVTGIDDHSRFCVCALLVPRATARPVCGALVGAMRAHGIPEGVLTDNGKVFTGRFGVTKTEVLFDRICRENGVRHLLTAPYSPTTTGKVERFHKTMRAEFFNTTTCDTIEALQAALDAWVEHYNTERPHQGIGDVPPALRFALAQPPVPEPIIDTDPDGGRVAAVPASVLPPARRVVNASGTISLARHSYPVGVWLAGEAVEVVVGDHLVEVFHRGVLIVSHVARHKPHTKITKRKPLNPNPTRARVRRGDNTPAVIRLVDTTGAISFAGASYKVGRNYARRSVRVAIVEGQVQITSKGELVRTHPIRHDRTKEHGALANPGGRPRKPIRVAS
jgi:transposase InsO family protein